MRGFAHKDRDYANSPPRFRLLASCTVHMNHMNLEARRAKCRGREKEVKHIVVHRLMLAKIEDAISALFSVSYRLVVDTL